MKRSTQLARQKVNTLSTISYEWVLPSTIVKKDCQKQSFLLDFKGKMGACSSVVERHSYKVDAGGPIPAMPTVLGA